MLHPERPAATTARPGLARRTMRWIKTHKVLSLSVYCLLYWGWAALATYSWMAFNTYRPVVLEVTEASLNPVTRCTENPKPKPCYYYVAAAKDGEYRNYDPESTLWYYLFKHDSATIQRKLQASIGQGPQVVYAIGLRYALKSWFPNVMGHPTPLAEVWVAPSLWWWLLLIRGGMLLLGLSPLWLGLQWLRRRKRPGPVESLNGPIDA